MVVGGFRRCGIDMYLLFIWVKFVCLNRCFNSVLICEYRFNKLVCVNVIECEYGCFIFGVVVCIGFKESFLVVNEDEIFFFKDRGGCFVFWVVCECILGEV